jgi:hypothetical protein
MDSLSTPKPAGFISVLCSIGLGGCQVGAGQREMPNLLIVYFIVGYVTGAAAAYESMQSKVFERG